MQRRQWDAKATASIGREGLQGKLVAELCNEYPLHQSHYYQGRDPCLAQASKAFAVHQDAQQDARLTREHARGKTLVGELTVACNNSAAWRGGVGTARAWSPHARKACSTGCRSSKPRPRSGATAGSGPLCASWSRGRCTSSGDGA
jgi:hypothetical protein